MLIIGFLLCLGLLAGYLLHTFVLSLKLQSVQSLKEELLQAAEKESNEIRDAAKAFAFATEKAANEKSVKLQQEIKIKEQEQKLKIKELAQTQQAVEKSQKELTKKSNDLKKAQDAHQNNLALQQQELEAIAKLTQNEAKAELYKKAAMDIETSLKKQFALQSQEFEEKLEERAKKLLLTTLSRIQLKQIPESSITLVTLPHDDFKAKLIGREGKNIKAFEEITGTTLIIDQTPNMVTLSSFDSTRRHLAKLTLVDLLQMEKINPQTIEKAYKANEEKLDESYMQQGIQAANDAQVTSLHPELLKILGKLHYRSSLGQNVLAHSVEVSHIMGLLASELQLNEAKARRIGLLHDIGKALPSELGLSHAIAGGNFAKSYNETLDVVNGISCHHDEVEPTSQEAMLCKLADSLSATRFGARSHSVEKHTKKLSLLEEIAKEFHGVERAFAIQAGRELQVFVKPELISDMQALELAQQIAEKIDSQAKAQGKVQVTVIRENKVTQFAKV